MKRHPNIGILIASLGGGGAERMAMRLCNSLPDEGYNTTLLTMDNTKDYSSNGIVDPIRLSFSNVTWLTPAKIVMAPWQWVKLEHKAKHLGIDLIISLMERANILNLIQNSVKRRLISIRTHTSMMMAAKSPLKRFLVKGSYERLLTRADKIVFNSVESKRDFAQFYGINSGKLEVIYNFCDVNRLQSMAKEPIPENLKGAFEGPTVIACGRLSRQKGQWHLIRAFKRVWENTRDARLVIIGKGPLKNDLISLCKDSKIMDRVYLPGFVQNPMSLIARAELFVMPSLWEGFPNALLEAMVVGTPVVSTDCMSGPRELMAPDSNPENKTDVPERTACGILIPPLDGKVRPISFQLSPSEAFLADAIEEILRDKEYHENCSKAVKTRAIDFSPERVLVNWKHIIDELL